MTLVDFGGCVEAHPHARARVGWGGEGVWIGEQRGGGVGPLGLLPAPVVPRLLAVPSRFALMLVCCLSSVGVFCPVRPYVVRAVRRRFFCLCLFVEDVRIRILIQELADVDTAVLIFTPSSRCSSVYVASSGGGSCQADRCASP